jgi:hypothetical protein
MGYQDENKQILLTELRFIHNCVRTFIQWMGRWWVLVHCGLFRTSYFPHEFFKPCLPTRFLEATPKSVFGRNQPPRSLGSSYKRASRLPRQLISSACQLNDASSRSIDSSAGLLQLASWPIRASSPLNPSSPSLPHPSHCNPNCIWSRKRKSCLIH